MTQETSIPPAVLQQAADWAITLTYDQPGAGQQQAFEQWLQQSELHRQAWARAQSVLATFGQVPDDIGRRVIKHDQRRQQRRQTLQLLSAMLLAPPAAWLAYRSEYLAGWRADLRTATGEQKRLHLPDGSVLALNTASALDVDFTDQQRRLNLLQGELMLTSVKTKVPLPPLQVATRAGVAEALGTRFSVRVLDSGLFRVAVFEDAVRITANSGRMLVVEQGWRADFSATDIQPAIPLNAHADLWEKGMWIVDNLPLQLVLQELSRYRPGLLRCDPAAASMPVSGTLSLRDTDAALHHLADTLNLRINRISPYWTTVSPL